MDSINVLNKRVNRLKKKRVDCARLRVAQCTRRFIHRFIHSLWISARRPQGYPQTCPQKKTTSAPTLWKIANIGKLSTTLSPPCGQSGRVPVDIPVDNPGLIHSLGPHLSTGPLIHRAGDNPVDNARAGASRPRPLSRTLPTGTGPGCPPPARPYRVTGRSP